MVTRLQTKPGTPVDYLRDRYSADRSLWYLRRLLSQRKRSSKFELLSLWKEAFSKIYDV